MYLQRKKPDADDLLLAKALWAGQVNVIDMDRIVVTNSSIGADMESRPKHERISDTGKYVQGAGRCCEGDSLI